MWNWREWSSHELRWATGIPLALFLSATLGFGPPWVWFLIIASFGGIGLWEFQRMVFPGGLPRWWLTFFILAGLVFPAGAFWGGAQGLQCSLPATVFGALLAMLLVSPLETGEISRVSFFVLGWVYIPLSLSYALLLGRLENGRALIFFILFVIAAEDIGAYYAGKKWGMRKLYERVSPNKTIEGSIGGLGAGMAVGVFWGLVFLPGLALPKLALLSLVLAAVGQVGDLFESMIKRICGQKDSSRLLPGHGGVLDRLDSLLFVFPTVWFFLQWMVG